MQIRKHLIIFSVIIILALLQSSLIAATKEKDLYEQYALVARVIQEVKSSYVDEVDEDVLFRGALKGIMETLDPYSAYIPPELYGQFQEDAAGAFGGLGIEITLDENNWLTVIAPMEGAPASRAGVLAGDKILKINGESTEGISLIEAVSKLRGKPGTPVTITVLHPGGTELEEITIVREVIKVESVKGFEKVNGEWKYWADPEKGIAYVRIGSFQQDTPQELDKVIKPLIKEGLKGLILDLRNDPGGLLASAVQVADRFIENGVIVSTRGRSTSEYKEMAHKRGTYPGFELAVLVNTWTASASEIVAGAIQDHKRGVLIGSETWGKGSVQDIIPLGEGRGALKLTKARYYTPSGKGIHRDPKTGKGGLIPDILVPLSETEAIELAKSFREKSRRKFLREPAEPERELSKGDLEKVPVLERFMKSTKKEEPEEKEHFYDTQLERALQYLRDILTYKATLGPSVTDLKASR